MIVTKRLIAAAALISIFTAPTLALTLTNRDAKEQKISVVQPHGATELTIAPGATVEIECKPECSIGFVSSEDEIDAIDGDKLEIVKNEILKPAS